MAVKESTAPATRAHVSRYEFFIKGGQDCADTPCVRGHGKIDKCGMNRMKGILCPLAGEAAEKAEIARSPPQPEYIR